MASLLLDHTESAELDAVLEKLERRFGADYTFIPEESSFSCKCSGPAQSCIWH